MAPLALTAEVVSNLEAALREHRRRGNGSRDLAAEIEVFLRQHPAASTIEIARSIRARDTSVRATLRADPHFERVAGAPNGSGRATRWDIARGKREPVPDDGTGSDTTVGDVS